MRNIEYKLSSRAMLAHVEINTWSGNMLDREVTEEVAKQKRASRNAGKYTKNLVGKDWLSPITKITSAARAKHYYLTFPGNIERGPRILSAKAWLDHSQEMSDYQSSFYSEVERFINSLPDIRETAQANLGELWREHEFPTEGEVRQRFAFRVNYHPIPEAGNWMLDLDSEIVDDLRKQVEQDTLDMAASAVQDTYARIAESVQEMADKVRAYNPDGDKVTGIFRNSLVSNMEELIKTLPKLNFTDDPRIDQIINDMKVLVHHSADELRESEAVRDSVASEADAIIEKMKGWMRA